MNAQVAAVDVPVNVGCGHGRQADCGLSRGVAARSAPDPARRGAPSSRRCRAAGGPCLRAPGCPSRAGWEPAATVSSRSAAALPTAATVCGWLPIRPSIATARSASDVSACAISASSTATAGDGDGTSRPRKAGPARASASSRRQPRSPRGVLREPKRRREAHGGAPLDCMAHPPRGYPAPAEGDCGRRGHPRSGSSACADWAEPNQGMQCSPELRFRTAVVVGRLGTPAHRTDAGFTANRA